MIRGENILEEHTARAAAYVNTKTESRDLENSIKTRNVIDVI